MESEERDRHAIANRIRDAQLPRMKTLEEFDFAQAPKIPAARIRELAEGGYIERSEPVVLIGECGTGKSSSGDRAVSGGVPAEAEGSLHDRGGTGQRVGGSETEQSGATVDEPVAEIRADRGGRGRVCALADIGAEFLFQVISERAERAALIVTTNLPFSEWTTVFPNPRLCKALLDRITDRAHIIETGTESFRFRRTVERRKKA